MSGGPAGCKDSEFKSFKSMNKQKSLTSASDVSYTTFTHPRTTLFFFIYFLFVADSFNVFSFVGFVLFSFVLFCFVLFVCFLVFFFFLRGGGCCICMG